MKIRRLMIAAVCMLFFSSCGLTPEKVSLSDSRLIPMLKAIAAVDRASLGFTAIPKDADVRVEWSGTRGGYDAMLHIYAATSRTIAFRKSPDENYRWIGEQEIHQGPKIYETPDGRFREQIVVDYQVERVSPGATGVPLTTIYISYSGNDPRFDWPKKLDLQQAQQIIQEWKGKPD